jgi:hypothetical protein
MTLHLILLSKESFQGGPDLVWNFMQQHETIYQWILTHEVIMWSHPYGSPIWSSQVLM